jgi:hypothetical protein
MINLIAIIDFNSKNKFEKLVHLVGFIIGIYHDTWLHERQTLTCLYRDLDNPK